MTIEIGRRHPGRAGSSMRVWNRHKRRSDPVRQNNRMMPTIVGARLGTAGVLAPILDMESLNRDHTGSTGDRSAARPASTHSR